jgi:HEAT repeat protein
MNRDAYMETAKEASSVSMSVMALKKFRQPMIEYLISGLEDNDKWVQVMAAQLLGTIGDSRAAEHLKPLLVSQDRDLRSTAAQSLAMIHPFQEIFSLSQSDNCGNCMIRLIADEAIQRLKNGNFDCTPRI